MPVLWLIFDFLFIFTANAASVDVCVCQDTCHSSCEFESIISFPDIGSFIQNLDTSQSTSTNKIEMCFLLDSSVSNNEISVNTIFTTKENILISFIPLKLSSVTIFIQNDFDSQNSVPYQNSYLSLKTIETESSLTAIFSNSQIMFKELRLSKVKMEFSNPDDITFAVESLFSDNSITFFDSVIMTNSFTYDIHLDEKDVTIDFGQQDSTISLSNFPNQINTEIFTIISSVKFEQNLILRTYQLLSTNIQFPKLYIEDISLITVQGPETSSSTLPSYEIVLRNLIDPIINCQSSIIPLRIDCPTLNTTFNIFYPETSITSLTSTYIILNEHDIDPTQFPIEEKDKYVIAIGLLRGIVQANTPNFHINVQSISLGIGQIEFPLIPCLGLKQVSTMRIESMPNVYFSRINAQLSYICNQDDSAYQHYYADEGITLIEFNAAFSSDAGTNIILVDTKGHFIHGFSANRDYIRYPDQSSVAISFRINQPNQNKYYSVSLHMIPPSQIPMKLCITNPSLFCQSDDVEFVDTITDLSTFSTDYFYPGVSFLSIRYKAIISTLDISNLNTESIEIVLTGAADSYIESLKMGTEESPITNILFDSFAFKTNCYINSNSFSVKANTLISFDPDVKLSFPDGIIMKAPSIFFRESNAHNFFDHIDGFLSVDLEAYQSTKIINIKDSQLELIAIDQGDTCIFPYEKIKSLSIQFIKESNIVLTDVTINLLYDLLVPLHIEFVKSLQNPNAKYNNISIYLNNFDLYEYNPNFQLNMNDLGTFLYKNGPFAVTEDNQIVTGSQIFEINNLYTRQKTICVYSTDKPNCENDLSVDEFNSLKRFHEFNNLTIKLFDVDTIPTIDISMLNSKHISFISSQSNTIKFVKVEETISNLQFTSIIFNSDLLTVDFSLIDIFSINQIEFSSNLKIINSPINLQANKLKCSCQQLASLSEVSINSELNLGGLISELSESKTINLNSNQLLNIELEDDSFDISLNDQSLQINKFHFQLTDVKVNFFLDDNQHCLIRSSLGSLIPITITASLDNTIVFEGEFQQVKTQLITITSAKNCNFIFNSNYVPCSIQIDSISTFTSMKSDVLIDFPISFKSTDSNLMLTSTLDSLVTFVLKKIESNLFVKISIPVPNVHLNVYKLQDCILSLSADLDYQSVVSFLDSPAFILSLEITLNIVSPLTDEKVVDFINKPIPLVKVSSIDSIILDQIKLTINKLIGSDNKPIRPTHGFIHSNFMLVKSTDSICLQMKENPMNIPYSICYVNDFDEDLFILDSQGNVCEFVLDSTSSLDISSYFDESHHPNHILLTIDSNSINSHINFDSNQFELINLDVYSNVFLTISFNFGLNRIKNLNLNNLIANIIGSFEIPSVSIYKSGFSEPTDLNGFHKIDCDFDSFKLISNLNYDHILNITESAITAANILFVFTSDYFTISLFDNYQFDHNLENTYFNLNVSSLSVSMIFEVVENTKNLPKLHLTTNCIQYYVGEMWDEVTSSQDNIDLIIYNEKNRDIQVEASSYPFYIGDLIYSREVKLPEFPDFDEFSIDSNLLIPSGRSYYFDITDFCNTLYHIYELYPIIDLNGNLEFGSNYENVEYSQFLVETSTLFEDPVGFVISNNDVIINDNVFAILQNVQIANELIMIGRSTLSISMYNYLPEFSNMASIELKFTSNGMPQIILNSRYSEIPRSIKINTDDEYDSEMIQFLNSTLFDIVVFKEGGDCAKWLEVVVLCNSFACSHLSLQCGQSQLSSSYPALQIKGNLIEPLPIEETESIEETTSDETYDSSEIDPTIDYTPTPQYTEDPMIPDDSNYGTSIESDSYSIILNKNGFIDDSGKEILINQGLTFIKVNPKEVQIYSEASQPSVFISPTQFHSILNIHNSNYEIGVHANEYYSKIILPSPSTKINVLAYNHHIGKLHFSLIGSQSNELKLNKLSVDKGNLELTCDEIIKTIIFETVHITSECEITIKNNEYDDLKFLLKHSKSDDVVIQSKSIVVDNNASLEINNLQVDTTLELRQNASISITDQISFNQGSSVSINLPSVPNNARIPILLNKKTITGHPSRLQLISDNIIINNPKEVVTVACGFVQDSVCETWKSALSGNLKHPYSQCKDLCLIVSSSALIDGLNDDSTQPFGIGFISMIIAVILVVFAILIVIIVLVKKKKKIELSEYENNNSMLETMNDEEE